MSTATSTRADAANLKRAYETAEGIAGYNRLRETVAHLAVWDDHDYGINDGGGDFPHKAVAKELFLKFWKVPATDVRRTREGIYNSRIIGPPGMRVQIILLDLRWFRSPLKVTDQRGAPGKERYVPDPDPGKTMLGPLQWAWLAGELRKPAEIRLIVSSTQVLAEGHGWERWGNMPLERQKLFDTIRDSGAKGVVLLSGDRHIGALYRETPAWPLSAPRADIERPQHGLSGPPRSPDRTAWARSTLRPISASSTSTGGNTRSRWRCATKAATRGDRRFSASMNWDLPDDRRKCLGDGGQRARVTETRPAATGRSPTI